MSCFMKQSVDEYTGRIAEGEFPQTFEEVTECGRALIRVNLRVTQTLAMIVAAGKEHFGNKLAAWVDWCKDEFGITDASYRCHLSQIGKMLHTLRKNDCFMKQFKRLFKLPNGKLIPLTRLPDEQLPAFLSHYPELETMDRLEVRAAVAAWLGESAPAETEQQLLPGFDALLDKLVDLDDKIMSLAPRLDTVSAFKMSFSGIRLCQASVGYIADHADAIDDEMLDELTEHVAMIHQRLASATADRRRKLLNNQ